MLAQDNGAIGTRTAASTPPAGTTANAATASAAAPSNQVVYSLRGAQPAAGVRLFRGGRMSGGLPAAGGQPAALASVVQLRQVDRLGRGRIYVVLTGTGLQRTADITAGTVAWKHPPGLFSERRPGGGPVFLRCRPAAATAAAATVGLPPDGRATGGVGPSSAASDRRQPGVALRAVHKSTPTTARASSPRWWPAPAR